MLFVGPSRLGKTTAHRRLTGEIVDIDSAGESEQISTGIVETGHSIVVHNISHTTAVLTQSEWSATKDLTHEACILFQFFNLKKISDLNETIEQGVIHADSNLHPQAEHPSGKHYSKFRKFIRRNVVQLFRKNFKIKRRAKATDSVMEEERNNNEKEVNTDSNTDLVMTDNEVFDFFQKAVTTNWEEVKFLLENTALLNMPDTGGRPEFMDMLPAFVIGPTLYLLF